MNKLLIEAYKKISINFKRKTVPTKEQFERKTNQTPPVQCIHRKNNWCYYYYAQRFHPSVGLNWLDRCLDKRHEIQEKINNKNAATLWELWTWTELRYNLHFLYWSLWNDKCWFSTFCIRIEEGGGSFIFENLLERTSKRQKTRSENLRYSSFAVCFFFCKCINEQIISIHLRLRWKQQTDNNIFFSNLPLKKNRLILKLKETWVWNIYIKKSVY